MKQVSAWVVAMLVPGIATAAGFDCGKASSAGEKAVCATPALSSLDSALGDAFRDALKRHPAQADDLRLDQRHWLATRDDIAWTFSTGAAKDALTGVLKTLYTRRIDQLKGLGVPPPRPLDALATGVARLSSGPDNVIEALAKAGTIMLATDQRVDSVSKLPFQPDAALRKALPDDGETLVARVLASAPVGSVYSIDGSAACYTEVPYRLDGKQATGVAMPAVWGTDCGSDHELARIGQDVAALRMDVASRDDVTLAASRWDGKRFGPALELSLRFDHALAPIGSACAPRQSPCDAFVTQVMPLVSRYDQRPQAGTIDRLPKDADKTAYDAAVVAARAKGGPLNGQGDDGFPELPDFGTTMTGGRMSVYDSEATPFPIVFRGETLMGLIGHGHVGWRANDDWVVSAWRLKDGHLQPVASVYVETRRGRLLFTSAVPPTPRADL
ncbi:lysozyme inhibitor LprI family protein [Luteibacter sp. PPL554]